MCFGFNVDNRGDDGAEEATDLPKLETTVKVTGC
jgi:hypothetical protein